MPANHQSIHEIPTGSVVLERASRERHPSNLCESEIVGQSPDRDAGSSGIETALPPKQTVRTLGGDR